LQNNKSKPYDRLDILLVSAVVVFFLLLYGKTLAVGLLDGDSAEFQVLSRELGLTHPMGYPIYILLGKLFSFLPWNELPWRINLLSAVAGALALGALYLLARLFTRNHWLALVAPFACGLTGIFWKTAITAEVYTTSMLTSNLVLLLVLNWERARKPHLLLIAGILGGLGLGIHSMVLLLAPAVLLYLIVCKAARKDWVLAACGGFIGLMLLAGAYYGLAAHNPAADNFHSVILPNLSRYGLVAADLDTPFERALFIATAQQFNGTLFSLPIEQVLIFIRTYFVSLFQSVGGAWTVLALTGLVAGFIPKKGTETRWKKGLLLGTALVILILIPANYSIRTGIIVFFLASYSLVALLALNGLELLWTAIESLLIRMKIVKETSRRKVVDGVLGLLLFGLVTTGFVIRLDPFHLQPVKPISDTSAIKLADIQWIHYYTTRELAESMVAQIPDGSLVFSDWGMLYPMQYVAVIQGIKPNLTIIERTPYPGKEELTQTELDLIASSYSTRPIYFTRVVKQLEKDYIFIRSDQEPYIYRLEKK
jgi:hypothetical protein